ncbi:hypothetical protein PSPO01_15981 [Paraphaeosphaeria sporulosa]
MSSLLEACDLYADDENQALICRVCKYALATAGSRVTTHLDKKHSVEKQVRKGLTKYIRHRPCQFRDPSTIPLRPDGSSPHPELQLHKGYACRECLEPTFHTTSFEWLKHPFSTAHLQGRASKSRIDGMYDDVFLQTWGDGPNRRYWTVLVNGSVVRPVNCPDAHDHLASTLQSTSLWMERTRWPITYQGVRRDVLLDLTAVPVTHHGVVLTVGQSAHGLNVTSPRMSRGYGI